VNWVFATVLHDNTATHVTVGCFRAGNRAATGPTLEIRHPAFGCDCYSMTTTADETSVPTLTESWPLS
jgi:hypothetical protein